MPAIAAMSAAAASRIDRPDTFCGFKSASLSPGRSGRRRHRRPGEFFDQRSKVSGQSGEARRFAEAGLVHIERAVDLDLQGMDPALRRAVVARCVGAGIGHVASHDIAALAERFAGRARSAAGRTTCRGSRRARYRPGGAARIRVGRAADRGHGMAIDQQADAETAPGCGRSPRPVPRDTAGKQALTRCSASSKRSLLR